MAVKRSKLQHYLNTGSFAAPAFKLMNLGITNLSISKNPTYLEEGYIADDVGTKELESLAPEFSFEINVDATDDVSVYLTELEWSDKTMTDVQTDIVTVQLFKAPTGSTYPAKRYLVSIGVETIGDEALKTLKHSIKAGVRGNAIFGTFNPTTKAFVAA